MVERNAEGHGPAEPHPDLAGYVLGTLTAAESAGFATHLGDCSQCQREVDDLGPIPARLALILPAPRLPGALQERTLAAVAAESRQVTNGLATNDASTRRPTRRLRWPAVAAAAAVLTFGAVAVLSQSPGAPPPRPRVVQLAAAGGSPVEATGVARLQPTPLGVVVELHLDGLGGPPPGTHYECWYVADDDTVAQPRRVSAGTFRVPTDGRAVVRMVTAADPKVFSSIEITLEDTDGDPARSGPAVLRGSRRR